MLFNAYNAYHWLYVQIVFDFDFVELNQFCTHFLFWLFYTKIEQKRDSLVEFEFPSQLKYPWEFGIQYLVI